MRALWIFSLLTACGGTLGLGTTTPGDITYQRDVRPLVEAHCVSCHVDGAIAPFALDDPEEAQRLGPQLVDSVVERRMPPWGLDPACRESTGSLWLPDEAVQTFRAWADGGYPMGDEAEFVAPELPAPPPDPGPADLVLEPIDAYTPAPGGADDYRCLPVSGTLDGEVFVTGARFVPDNVEVVHHVILFAVPPDGVAELEARIAEDPEPGYVCFGDSGLDNAMTVGGWVPGQTDMLLPDGVASRIPAGSRLVMQMHYNSAAQPEPRPDRTRAELWTLPPGQEPDELMIVYPIVKLGLHVGAGEQGVEQVARQRVPIEGARIIGSHPHMHLSGRSLSTRVIRADGSEQCVSQVDQWDFDWQRTYGVPQDQWIPLSVDDEIEIRCTYDNDTDHPIAWGDGTADEMCLDYLGLIVPWEGAATDGVCAAYPVCTQGCAPDDPFCHLACMTASGDSCLFCGLENVLGECVGIQCPLQGLGLLACMDSCAPGQHLEDVVGCLYDECRDAFEGYWTCTAPLLESGACPEQFDGCPEIIGGAW